LLSYPQAEILPGLATMRELSSHELETVFKKMAEYTGASLKDLIAQDDSPQADRNVFRLSQQRVFCVRLSIANLAVSISRDRLLSLGTCLGKIVFSQQAIAVR
jgi:60S ribosome subunit biogenesis protein NIP7